MRVVRLTVFTSQHPFTKGYCRQALAGREKAVCNPPLVLLLHLHFFLIFRGDLSHKHTQTRTHAYISLPAPLFRCLINVCVLYPLLFAPRQLRHCSDGGGGRVYMCACVWVCQRQRGRARECRTEMEGGVSRDRERRGEMFRIKSWE